MVSLGPTRRVWTTLLPVAVIVPALSGCFAAQQESGPALSVPSVGVSVIAIPSSTGTRGTARVTPTGAAMATPASPTPLAAVSPQPGVSPSGAVLRPPTLPTLKGYRYAKAPASVVAAFLAARPQPAGVLGPPTVVSVSQGEDPLGSIAARALDATHAGDVTVENSLVASLVAGLPKSGYTVRTQKLTGGRVTVATRKGSTILTWYDRGVVVQLVSSGPAEGPLGYAKAYLAR